MAFHDLTASTNYVFKLFTQVVPEYEYHTNIRIDHHANAYFALIEVSPFDTSGNIVPPELFTFASSKTHSTGYTENAMNGDSNTGVWTSGAFLEPNGNAYWEAQFSPVQLSGIRLYASTSHNFASDSTLTMTKSNGDTVQYSLDGEHNIGSLTHIQQIAFPKT